VFPAFGLQPVQNAQVSTLGVTGVLLVTLPLAFNAVFAVLAATFDYPDVLRRPTDEVLARFRGGGTTLVLWWWAFALTAVVLVPLAVLLARALDGAGGTLRDLSATVGVLAAAWPSANTSVTCSPARGVCWSGSRSRRPRSPPTGSGSRAS
jgi:hypothetical protein